MKEGTQALHIEVLHALPGRLRLKLEKSPQETILPSVSGIKEASWNPRLQTMLVRYDAGSITQEQMLLRLSAAYAKDLNASLIHIRHSEEAIETLAPSAFLALGCIGLDGLMTLTGTTLFPARRWISLATTLAAVFEHGYHELKTRGTFDPEVMSIVYLVNAIGKTATAQSALMAWIVTFGRHLIPLSPREQAYLAHEENGSMQMTTVRCDDRQSMLRSLVDGSVTALSRKERRVVGL